MMCMAFEQDAVSELSCGVLIDNPCEHIDASVGNNAQIPPTELPDTQSGLRTLPDAADLRLWASQASKRRGASPEECRGTAVGQRRLTTLVLVFPALSERPWRQDSGLERCVGGWTGARGIRLSQQLLGRLPPSLGHR